MVHEYKKGKDVKGVVSQTLAQVKGYDVTPNIGKGYTGSAKLEKVDMRKVDGKKVKTRTTESVVGNILYKRKK